MRPVERLIYSADKSGTQLSGPYPALLRLTLRYLGLHSFSSSILYALYTTPHNSLT